MIFMASSFICNVDIESMLLLVAKIYVKGQVDPVCTTIWPSLGYHALMKKSVKFYHSLSFLYFNPGPLQYLEMLTVSFNTRLVQ